MESRVEKHHYLTHLFSFFGGGCDKICSLLSTRAPLFLKEVRASPRRADKVTLKRKRKMKNVYLDLPGLWPNFHEPRSKSRRTLVLRVLGRRRITSHIKKSATLLLSPGSLHWGWKRLAIFVLAYWLNGATETECTSQLKSGSRCEVCIIVDPTSTFHRC